MRLLSEIDNLGQLSSCSRPPQYIALPGAPRRIVRAVDLVNYADSVVGGNFPTYEDALVHKDKRRCRILVFALTAAIIGIGTTPEAVVRHLAIGIIGITAINLLTRLVSRMTLMEWLAARLLGAPVRPRRFIREGLAKGWVFEVKSELRAVYYAHLARCRHLKPADQKALEGEFVRQLTKLNQLLADLRDPLLKPETVRRGWQRFQQLEGEMRAALEAQSRVLAELDAAMPSADADPASPATAAELRAGQAAAANYKFRQDWGALI